MQPLTLIVHNVRSAHNVGSILRTAECADVTKVYLCGYTPTPTDRFGRKQNDIAKVALGAEDVVAWEHCASTTDLIHELHATGMSVIALEQDKRSVPYTDVTLNRPTALVLGEEVHGIPDDVLTECDTVMEIPMRGTKESLNVSVAAGIAVFYLIEKGA